MNKGGQFYIIAAVIIVLIIIGAAGVRTYTIVKSKPKSITDLSSMLNLEGSKVVDYGIYSGEKTEDYLNDFGENVVAPYFASKVDEAEMIIIYKGDDGFTGQKITKGSSGETSTSFGAGMDHERSDPQRLEEGKDFELSDTNRDGEMDQITLNMGGQRFPFPLGENQIFYFGFIQEEAGETYIGKSLPESQGREWN